MVVSACGPAKIKQILRRDWLPAPARWGYLAFSGLPVRYSGAIVHGKYI